MSRAGLPRFFDPSYWWYSLNKRWFGPLAVLTTIINIYIYIKPTKVGQFCQIIRCYAWNWSQLFTQVWSIDKFKERLEVHAPPPQVHLIHQGFNLLGWSKFGIMIPHESSLKPMIWLRSFIVCFKWGPAEWLFKFFAVIIRGREKIGPNQCSIWFDFIVSLFCG